MRDRQVAEDIFVATSGADRVVEAGAADEGGGFYLRHGKRVLDVAVAVFLLLALGPLILLLLAVAALDGASPIFSHRRIGRNGREFDCLKVRTMVPDAEQRLALILADDPGAEAEWRSGRKLAVDPRITRLGRLLRATSLDELPQLLNVLRGEMSLVGPRPVTQSELNWYGEEGKYYLMSRPGMTGLWQVQGRNEVSYRARVLMDAEYMRNVSLASDLRILLATAAVVLAANGR